MALAVIGLALGQVGARLHAAAVVPSHEHAAAEHAGHHGPEHAAAADHAGEHPEPGKHQHSALGCVVACCITVSNASRPASGAGCVQFGSAVVYGEPTQPGSGRRDAPEPGIPKHRA